MQHLVGVVNLRWEMVMFTFLTSSQIWHMSVVNGKGVASLVNMHWGWCLMKGLSPLILCPLTSRVKLTSKHMESTFTQCLTQAIDQNTIYQLLPLLPPPLSIKRGVGRHAKQRKRGPNEAKKGQRNISLKSMYLNEDSCFMLRVSFYIGMTL